MLSSVFLVFGLLMVARWLAPIVRAQRQWVYAGPIDPISLDINGLPQPLREKVFNEIHTLEAIGFRTIGACRWAHSLQSSCYVVLTKDDFTAELAFTRLPSAPVWITIGQEYSDGTSLSVSNLYNPRIAPDLSHLRLPGVVDAARLHWVAEHLIERHRGDREAFTPNDVCKYKADDLSHWRKQIQDSRYYRLDKRRNRYRPNWRYFIYLLHARMFRSRRHARSRYQTDQRTVNLVLHELDCGSLESLRMPAPRAFPVIMPAETLP